MYITFWEYFHSVSFLAQAIKYLMQKNKALQLQLNKDLCILKWHHCQCPIYLEQLEHSKIWGQQKYVDGYSICHHHSPRKLIDPSSFTDEKNKLRIVHD